MLSPVRLLLKAHDGLTRIGYLGGIAALGLITVSYVYEVVARYFFASPTTWAADLVGYSLCAGIFLTLPHVTATRAHVAVTIVLDTVPRGVAVWLHAIINVLGFGFCAFAAWISAQENMRQFSRTILTLGADPIPKWWVTTFITFGLILASLHFLRHAAVPAERPGAGERADDGLV